MARRSNRGPPRAPRRLTATRRSGRHACCRTHSNGCLPSDVMLGGSNMIGGNVATHPGWRAILFGPIVAVSVSENKFGGSVVVVDRPETAGSSE